MSRISGQHAPEKKATGSTREMVIVIIEALLLALTIRTFLFQPFTIPSGSMRPTLLVGDYLFVSKYAYGYSHFSLPLAPDLFSGRIWSAEPKRGDIVIFRHPGDTSLDYIKRVVGLPGDSIQMQGSVLYINGTAVQREKIGETRDVDMIGDLPPPISHIFNPAVDRPVSVYRETLPNNVSYNTFDIFPMGPGDNTGVYEVPAEHYFMMGDNRDNSLDSRFELGYVPFENLVGRANLIFFSIGDDSSAWQLWRWPANIRWGRLFSFVQTVKDVPPGP